MNHFRQKKRKGVGGGGGGGGGGAKKTTHLVRATLMGVAKNGVPNAILQP